MMGQQGEGVQEEEKEKEEECPIVLELCQVCQKVGMKGGERRKGGEKEYRIGKEEG